MIAELPAPAGGERCTTVLGGREARNHARDHGRATPGRALPPHGRARPVGCWTNRPPDRSPTRGSGAPATGSCWARGTDAAGERAAGTTQPARPSGG
jgi:hypothetical protein